MFICKSILSFNLLHAPITRHFKCPQSPSLCLYDCPGLALTTHIHVFNNISFSKLIELTLYNFCFQLSSTLAWIILDSWHLFFIRFFSQVILHPRQQKIYLYTSIYHRFDNSSFINLYIKINKSYNYLLIRIHLIAINTFLRWRR